MKTTETNDRLTRWLDGAMNPGERTAFERELADNPALRAEAEAMQRIGGLLRANVTLEKPVPSADFFNSQIQDHIAELQRADDRRKSRSGGGAAGWFGWLRTPWAMAGAVALVTLGFFVLRPHQDTATQILSFYAPDPSVHATARQDAAADATILTLDGLSAIPDDQPISMLRDSGPAILNMTPEGGLTGAALVAAN